MDQQKSKTIYVTGAAGYIGSVVCKRLIEEGYKVFANDLLPIEHSYYTWKYTRKSFETFFDGVPPAIDAVVHLAAHSLLGPSVKHPFPYMENNAIKTFQMLKHLRRYNIPIIFSSTAAVYGNNPKDNLPFVETDIPNPCNPYGESKAAAETFIKASGLDYVIFRYFNVCGSYGDVGQKSDQPHIMTALCRHMNDPVNKKFTLNGNDFNTPDGTCIRDYVHVRDIAEAHIQVLDKMLFTGKSIKEIYNLGRGVGYSNLEIIELFGIDIQDITIGPSRPGDPGILFSNPDKFMDNFDYRFPHSSIENMIQSHKEYFNGKR